MASQMARTRSLSGVVCQPTERYDFFFKKNALNITVWRSHRRGCNTEDIKDDLLGPTKLSNDLFVCLSSEGSMAPGMDSDLVAVHVFILKNIWV